MSLRPYKFLVQAIVQEVDDDGNVTREIGGQTVELYGLAAVSKWADDFPANLAREEADLPA